MDPADSDPLPRVGSYSGAGRPGLTALFRALRRLRAPTPPPHALGSWPALLPPPGRCRHRPDGWTRAPPPPPALLTLGGVTILNLSLRAHAEIYTPRPPTA